MQIFVDGKSAALDIANDSLKGSLVSPIVLDVGKRGHSLPFKGKIDEVQLLYQRLTVADVARLASGHSVGGLLDVLAVEPGKRTGPQRAQVRQYFLENVDAEYRKLRAEQQDLVKQKAAPLEKLAVPTMVMQEMPTRARHVRPQARPVRPARRQGSARRAGVSAAAAQGAPTDRLGLAQWLVAPANPLTARVAVNRWWAILFRHRPRRNRRGLRPPGRSAQPSGAARLAGHGIRPQRLGRQGDAEADRHLGDLPAVKPCHPGSCSNATPRTVCWPDRPRFRLPAEAIRDNALAISGLLKESIGGPSVKPYQPAGLWEDVSVERRYKYVADKGEGLYRRSMYTFWRRTCPPPA